MSKLNSKSLLERQLKKLELSSETLPTRLEDWQAFLEKVEKAYEEFNSQRINSENLLEVSLSEMERLQAEFSESNQKKMLELNNYLKLILEAAEMGTWDWDLTDNTLHFDQRWCQMLGYNSDELAHSLETFKKLVHPNEIEQVMHNAQDYLEKKINRYEARFQMMHKDGHWVDILAKGKIISFDTSGKPLRFIGTHLDVSEEKKLQRELESQRVKLIRTSKLASLGELAAGVAHEINNPLTIILGTTEILPLMLDNPGGFADKIEKINRACLRIAKIVKGLKKFSRSGDQSNMKAQVLNEIVKEAISLTESKSKVNFTPVSAEYSGEYTILCDEIEIEQVIVNLIHNAIDALKQHDERWVKLFLFEDQDKVILRVMDAGDGIPPEVEQKLFQPFFTTKAVGEGTGLGLSITKGILEEHKATISILHDQTHTCFEIKFPKYDPALEFMESLDTKKF